MSRTRRWAALFGLWTVLGLFMFSQGLAQKVIARDTHPWWHSLVSWLVGVWLWYALTPGILWLGTRFPLDRKPLWRTMAIHLPISLVFAFGDLAIEAQILRWAHVFPDIMASYSATLGFLVIIGYNQSVVTYWTVLGAQYAFRSYGLTLRTSQLERQLAEAHVRALKSQLQPHFLFNTLNTIMVLVRQHKGREAERMLAQLSDLLRCVLEDVQVQEVPLTRELEYLKLYLAIEQVRFQDRLRVDIAADPEVLDAALPHLALQPLVENAIRHGIGKRSAAGCISIVARRVDDRVRITVRDDGPGLTPAQGTATGIGLANTRARLREMYGTAAGLTVENADPSGVIATLTLPLRAACA